MCIECRKAHADRSAVQRSGTFVGIGSAMKSGADGNVLLCQRFRRRFAVHAAHTEGKHAALSVAAKYFQSCLSLQQPLQMAQKSLLSFTL